MKSVCWTRRPGSWLVRIASVALLASICPAQTETSAVGAARYSEIARKKRQLSDHAVTVVKIRPPTLRTAPASLAARVLSEEERAVAERRAKKSYESLTLSGTVYLDGDRVLTELTWTVDERRYRAFSTADFRLLTQIMELETESSVYLWFPFIAATEGWPVDAITALAQLGKNGKEADYLIEGGVGEVNAHMDDALDYLHAYYELNKPSLRAAFLQREAEQEERDLRPVAPPASKMIYFWPGKAKP